MRSNAPYVIYQDCYSFINLNKKLEEKILLSCFFSFRSIAVVVLTMTPSQTMMTTMSGFLILLSIMSWSEAELLLPHRS